MLSNDQKISVIEKICDSEEFNKREVYCKLLKYLLDCHLTSTQTKEYQIAIDVLDKEKEFDSSHDTSVRYRIHKLRELLNKYYQTEGSEESVTVEIPKGVYKLVFNEIKKENTAQTGSSNSSLDISKTVLRNKRITTINGSILAVLSIILIYMLLNVDEKSTTKYDEIQIWKSFLDNNLENTLVIGDFYVFHEKDPELGYNRRIMDYSIRDENSLDEYISNYPNRYVEKHKLGEAPHNSLYNILDLQPVFNANNKSLNLEWTTTLKMNDIKDHNVVYIGEFRNMRILRTLLENLSVEYSFDEEANKHLFRINDSELPNSFPKVYEKFAVSPPEHAYNDYGMAVKLPGFNNENYMLFIGLGYISQIQLVKLFSTPDKAMGIEQKIEEQLGDIPEYFQLFVRTTGYDFTDYTSEILYVKEINKDNYLKKLSHP